MRPLSRKNWKNEERFSARLRTRKSWLTSFVVVTILVWMGKIKEALSLVKGGFAYILLFEDKLIAALDPNGFRPLSIGKMANGAVVVSSETCAFEVIGAEWIRDLKPGEIVIIDDKGIQYDSYTDDTQLAICSMEYIYFCSP